MENRDPLTYTQILEYYTPVAFVKKIEMTSRMIADVIACDDSFLHSTVESLHAKIMGARQG